VEEADFQQLGKEGLLADLHKSANLLGLRNKKRVHAK
jgi:hypothetical protein